MREPRIQFFKRFVKNLQTRMKPSKPVWCNYGQNPAPLHVPPKAFVHPKCFNLLTYISLHLPRARCFFKCPISKKNGASIFHSTSWFETFRKQLKYPPIPKTSQLESQGKSSWCMSMELQKLCKQKQYKYSTLSPKRGATKNTMMNI